jgi:hypothetical protein
MLSYESLQRLPQHSQPHTHEVTVSIHVNNETAAIITHSPSPKPESAGRLLHAPDITCTQMTSKMELLECPMCKFAVLPKDDYILQLHFEQVHTENSPFIIEDDPEPLPPSLPLGPSSAHHDTEDSPSSDYSEEEEASTVVCPDSNCGEVVPLSDFNDHLDYHNAETLSFDETTGKYHSHHSSATMQHPTSSRRSHASQAKTTTSERSFSTHLSDGLRKNEAHGRKSQKNTHRHRRDTDESERSTIGRSILGFNPFAKPDKTVKPPTKSARLGVSGSISWQGPANVYRKMS